MISSKRNIVMLLIIPLVITYICTYLDDESRDSLKVYNAAVIDYDKTERSSTLIEKIKGYNEIELSTEENLEESIKKLVRGKYDVVYEIKDGYEDKILNGEFTDILVSHKEVNSTAIRWLNDQISLLVVRNWLYVDALNRVRSLDSDYSEVEFNEKFEAAMADNKILSLKIHEISNKENVLGEDREPIGSYTFKLLWASIILFFVMGFGKKIIDDKKRGIITRLELSGISKMKYYITNFIITLLSSIIPYTISYFLMGYINLNNISGFFMNILFTILYIIFTWIMILCLVFISDSKKSYSLASQVFLLVSIIAETGLLNSTSIISDYVSWIFPLKWYVEFIS